MNPFAGLYAREPAPPPPSARRDTVLVSLLREYLRLRHVGSLQRLMARRYINSLRAHRYGLPEPHHGRVWTGHVERVRRPKFSSPPAK